MSTAAGGTFRSILWPDGPDDAVREDAPEPACFHDLNLDQVVAAVTTDWEAENLAPFFRVPARDPETIRWRQAVLNDLEHAPLRQVVTAFVERMRATHSRLRGAEKLRYDHERKRALLGAANEYCDATRELTHALQRLDPTSTGLRALRDHLAAYIASDAFGKLAGDAAAYLRGLDAIRYDLLIRDNSVTVRPFRDEAEASGAVEATFARFRSDTATQTHTPARGPIGVNGINHIEAQVLDRVALLFPDAFTALDAFCGEHADFIDPTLARFAREACFFLAWLAYTLPLRAADLPLCLPEIDAASKHVEATDAFDIALAAQLVAQRQAVVRNDFALHGDERVLVVSGPNHGGKTTFARMFGQMHWLATLGLTVPGRRAALFPFDQLFTHFEREERIESLRGKLKDDLVRIHGILEAATPRSVIILNEIFASTTLDDALRLGRRVLARIATLDALAVCVTFLVELASLDEKTVSMVAEIDPNDPAIRTFRIERRPADGLAHALAVANKHRVTRAQLIERIAP